MLNFIEKTIDAEGLINGFDYAIVSMTVIDHDYETYSIDEWYSFESLTYFNSERVSKNHYESILKILKERKPYNLGITPTQLVENGTFYLPIEKIDPSAAITFGLGVVEILRGEESGQFMLYNSVKMNEEDIADEILTLKLYFQYTNPVGYFDEGLNYFIKTSGVMRKV